MKLKSYSFSADLISAEICKQPIAKSSNLTASSEYGKKDATHMYGAERGYLDTKEEVINGVTEIGGWAAATNDQNQFIQVGLTKMFREHWSK